MSASFFAFFDDIALLMDDVASMTKVATKKTAGLLGDDLAVNAEKSSGFLTNRELPVLWKITKGAFLNKVMILPVAFLLNAYAPLVVQGILILGGIYLAYEGVEKIYHYLFHRKGKTVAVVKKKLESENSKELEQEKVKSAIFVDFILSIEIIIIALSTVTEAEMRVQIIVVTLIAILATVGVYSVVALIVRMDDLGFQLIKESENKYGRYLGKALVAGLPWVIRILTLVGTIALLLVSGGIFKHNIPWLHHLAEIIPSIAADMILGIIVGVLAVAAMKLFTKLKPAKAAI